MSAVRSFGSKAECVYGCVKSSEFAVQMAPIYCIASDEQLQTSTYFDVVFFMDTVAHLTGKLSWGQYLHMAMSVLYMELGVTCLAVVSPGATITNGGFRDMVAEVERRKYLPPRYVIWMIQGMDVYNILPTEATPFFMQALARSLRLVVESYKADYVRIIFGGGASLWQYDRSMTASAAFTYDLAVWYVVQRLQKQGWTITSGVQLLQRITRDRPALRFGAESFEYTMHGYLAILGWAGHSRAVSRAKL